jgi:hypothetical protein
MTNLVTQLRLSAFPLKAQDVQLPLWTGDSGVFIQAADEIERLRAALEEARGCHDQPCSCGACFAISNALNRPSHGTGEVAVTNERSLVDRLDRILSDPYVANRAMSKTIREAMDTIRAHEPSVVTEYRGPPSPAKGLAAGAPGAESTAAPSIPVGLLDATCKSCGKVWKVSKPEYGAPSPCMLCGGPVYFAVAAVKST